MGKNGIAFLLGVFSFVLGMFVGESAGMVPAGAVLMTYFCLCQFLLSRRDPDARRDWSLMLALDAAWLLVVLAMVIVEKLPVILSQGPIILFATCGGTYLGAVAASRAAKRMGRTPAGAA